MMSALIVYASFTGNTEEAARYVAKIFTESGVKVKIEECTQVSPREFLDFDINIVGTYTWGRSAELPDEIVDFYEEMKTLDLKGKVYGTFGSGDILYDKFCQSVDDFNRMFESCNALQGADSVKIEDGPEEEDFAHLKNFVTSLINKAKEIKAL